MGRVASAFDGVDIEFDVEGAGSPLLVFIHGLVGDRSDFADQVAHFRGSHRVVALDLPGNGASGRDRRTWTMAAFGEDVATVVDHLDADAVVVIGHSLGGDVAVEAALRLGDRVRAVIMISSYQSIGAPKTGEQLDRWLRPFRDDYAAAADDLARRNFGPNASAELVDRIAARMVGGDARIVGEVLSAKMANEPELLAGLAELRVPVVAINSDNKPNDADSLAAHGIALRVVPGVGHFVMLEAPVDFNQALDSVIAQRAG